jgi:hypothetical protein
VDREHLDALTKRFTAYDSFSEFLDATNAPTMREDMHPDVTVLANAFDGRRKALGRSLSWRPYRRAS